jgi:hypothetical protein
LDEQTEAVCLFDRTVQRQPAATLRALEDRQGLPHAAFEFRFGSWLYVDLCDFEDHRRFPLLPAKSGRK